MRVPLLQKCSAAYWQPAYAGLTLDHPLRMATAFAVLCADCTPRNLFHRLLDEMELARRENANPCDPRTQQVRQEFLDWLYECSGRTCNTYSGLYEEYLLSEAARLNEEPCH